MKTLVATAVLTLFCCSSFCQDLARKGSFGVQMQNNPDGNGIQVLKVIENSTASNLGLEKNDILIDVNQITFNDVNPLVEEIGKWEADDRIKVTVRRGGKELVLNGKVNGKPYEQSDYAEVIYGSVDFDGGKLRSILELPHGAENPPVVFFLPGVGCGSLDYYYNPGAPIKLLVESIVKEGIAVYRVEKPGMGDSNGTIDCLEMDFNYEVAAFETALHQLKNLEGIDSSSIFLYGHSLGAISAPVIASKNSVAGIIAWGGVSTTWFEYLLKIERDQKVLRGIEYLNIDSSFQNIMQFKYELLVNKKTPKELTASPEFAHFSDDFVDGKYWYGLQHYEFFQTLNEVNVLTSYIKSDCPVLTLAGEFDLHAIDTSWATEIASAVNSYNLGRAEAKVIAGTTHHYHTVPSKKAYNEMRANGGISSQYMTQNFNSDIGTLVAEWIKNLKPI